MKAFLVLFILVLGLCFTAHSQQLSLNSPLISKANDQLYYMDLSEGSAPLTATITTHKKHTYWVGYQRKNDHTGEYEPVGTQLAGKTKTSVSTDIMMSNAGEYIFYPYYNSKSEADHAKSAVTLICATDQSAYLFSIYYRNGTLSVEDKNAEKPLSETTVQVASFPATLVFSFTSDRTLQTATVRLKISKENNQSPTKFSDYSNDTFPTDPSTPKDIRMEKQITEAGNYKFELFNDNDVLMVSKIMKVLK